MTTNANRVHDSSVICCSCIQRDMKNLVRVPSASVSPLACLWIAPDADAPAKIINRIYPQRIPQPTALMSFMFCPFYLLLLVAFAVFKSPTPILTAIILCSSQFNQARSPEYVPVSPRSSIITLIVESPYPASHGPTASHDHVLEVL